METATLEAIINELKSKLEQQARLSVMVEDFYRINRQLNSDVPKEVFVRHFDTPNEYISIIPITDIHLGSMMFKEDKLRPFIEYILNNEDMYAICLGDTIENASKQSIGAGVYDQDMSPDEQISRAVDLLKPLADAGKLLGIHSGNHEYRTYIHSGVDVARMIAKMLNVPYLGYQAYHKWVVGNTVYHAFTYHGKGNSRTPGTRLNSARKLNEIANVDLYIQGHLHNKIDDEDIIYEIDDETNRVVTRRRKYVIAGSLLGYFGGYSEVNGYAPVVTGFVRIDLYKNVKDIKVYK